MSTLTPHPHIKSVTGEVEIQPDGTLKVVTVVYTDLELRDSHPAHDAEAFERLVNRIRDFQKNSGQQEVRLRNFRD